MSIDLKSEPATKIRQVTSMFGRIAPSYDLVNRMMSLGKDQSWRRLAASLANPPADGIALDVASGTGDLALVLAERTSRVIASDPCAPMVEIGREKVAAQPRGKAIKFVLADAQELPFVRDSAPLDMAPSCNAQAPLRTLQRWLNRWFRW